MSAITFTLKNTIHQAVDCKNLTPDLLQGKSIKAIKAIKLNANLSVADVFDVTGDDATQVVFKNTNAETNYIGHKMRNGIITIENDAGDFVGAEMKGGTIICKSNVGDRAADKMRRGMLLIEGNVADYCCANMIAGTVGILGNAGDYLGYSMRRGTLLLANAPKTQATWVNCGLHSLPFLKLLFKSFAQFNSKFSKLQATRVERWMGDISGMGKAEILLLKSN